MIKEEKFLNPKDVGDESQDVEGVEKEEVVLTEEEEKKMRNLVDILSSSELRGDESSVSFSLYQKGIIPINTPLGDIWNYIPMDIAESMVVKKLSGVLENKGLVYFVDMIENSEKIGLIIPFESFNTPHFYEKILNQIKTQKNLSLLMKIKKIIPEISKEIIIDLFKKGIIEIISTASITKFIKHEREQIISELGVSDDFFYDQEMQSAALKGLNKCSFCWGTIDKNSFLIFPT